VLMIDRSPENSNVPRGISKIFYERTEATHPVSPVWMESFSSSTQSSLTRM
jgi:hypothetical protein